MVSALFCAALFAGTANAAGSKVFVKLQTSMGNIVLELDKAKAPITVENFLRYVNEGHYERNHLSPRNRRLHDSGRQLRQKHETERPTHAPIENEARNGLYNDKYTIAMARTNDPHSATDQFFINVKDNDFLNFKSESGSGWGYAVFGKVIGGKKVVDKIAKTVTFRKGHFSDVPVKPITIIKAEELKQ